MFQCYSMQRPMKWACHRDRLTEVTRLLLVTVASAAFVLFTVACGGRHVAVGVGVGGPPVCPYGYYEAPPYDCAPDGYYGPEWFQGGVFLGAGPWYHGPGRFYGRVDHDLDYRHGYRGPYPTRGSQPAPRRAEFHGQAMHDSRGREAPKNRK